MSLSLVGLIMIAALLHATWNAIIKLGEDRLVAMAILSGSSGLIGLALVPFFPVPLPVSWPFIAATSFIHIGYIWFLTKAYEHGDFGEVYPVARGFAPLLTTLGAFVFAGELPEPLGLGGVALVAIGIMSLALAGRSARAHVLEEVTGKRSTKPLIYALLTGCFIASYTLVDGFGARASGTVGGYTAWLFFLHGLPLFFLVAYLRRGTLFGAVQRNWKSGVVGGALSFGAYWIVIWAFTLGALAPVAALRETSVVFAAVIAAVHLKEGLGWQRLCSAGLVAGGILFLAL
jgi:drug/metabolite transporter (DMT)-like permease